MKFFIKQKVFSFGDNFTVKNENDEPIIVVKGKVFSLGNKLTILDANQNEIYKIEQKLFKLLPEYRIFENDREVALLKREFSLFKPKIRISSEYGDFSITGSLFAYNFDIHDGGNTVATINKAILSFGDAYELDIVDGMHIPFMVTLVIVIDQMLHDSNKGANNS